MNRINFKDRRGDEYTFLQFNMGDLKITKKSRFSDGSHKIDFSAEAAEKLHKFLHIEEKDLLEEDS